MNSSITLPATTKLISILARIRQQKGIFFFHWTMDTATCDLLQLSASPALSSRIQFYGEKPEEEWGLLALDCLERLTPEPGDSILQIKSQLDQFRARCLGYSPGSISMPIIVGGCAFDPSCNSLNHWQTIPSREFVLPGIYWLKTCKGTTLTIIIPLDGSESASDVQSVLGEKLEFITNCNDLIRFEKNEVVADYHFPARDRYHQQVKKTQDFIQSSAQKQIQKVVLSRFRKITFANPVNPVPLLINLRRLYPQCLIYFFPLGENKFLLGATPELLIEKTHDVISTMALAGTAEKHDELPLSQDPKEQLEHQLVIDHLLDKLGDFVSSVEVGSPKTWLLQNLCHLRTDITGVLQKKEHILDILTEIHPTPATAGYPVEPVLPFIAQTEEGCRGWYAGVLGWMDGCGDGAYYVGLRSALLDGYDLYIHAGGGILPASDPEQEWQETQLKMESILTAMDLKGSI